MGAIYYEAEKDPDSVLSYVINWASEDGTNDGSDSDTGWLQGDTISASTWDVPTGITVDTESNTTKVAKIVLSAGSADAIYLCTNHITTAAGLEDDRILIVRMLPAATDPVITLTPYVTVAEADVILARSAKWSVASSAQKLNSLSWARVYIDSVYDVSAIDEDDAPELLKQANSILADENLNQSLFARQSIDSMLTSKTVSAGGVSTSKSYDSGKTAKWVDPVPYVTALLYSVCPIIKASGVAVYLMRG